MYRDIYTNGIFEETATKPKVFKTSVYQSFFDTLKVSENSSVFEREMYLYFIRYISRKYSNYDDILSNPSTKYDDCNSIPSYWIEEVIDEGGYLKMEFKNELSLFLKSKGINKEGGYCEKGYTELFRGVKLV